MNLKSTIIASASLSIAAILFSGCLGGEATPEPTIVEEAVQKRSQELVIKYDVKAKKEKKRTINHYEVYLNNITKPKVDLTLQNVGEKTLELIDIDLQGNPKLFKMSKSCDDELKGRDKCKLHIEFVGKKKEHSEALIVIKSNDRRRKVTNIKIYAEGKDLYRGSVEQKKTDEIDNWVNEKIKTTYIHIDSKYQKCEFKTDGWVK